MPGGDPPGEAPAERNPHALAHFLFKTRSRCGNQLPGRPIQQEHSSGVGTQDVLSTFQQRIQQILVIQAGQLSVRDRLDVPEPVRHRIRSRPCTHLDAFRLAGRLRRDGIDSSVGPRPACAMVCHQSSG